MLISTTFETPDFDQAIVYYRKGIALKIGTSFYNLGMMYFAGKGVEENLQKAKELFEKGME